ncbi:MAG TPA: MBL fold metallo-hydrolase [Chitinophagales bacterium]|nr:MBL fold metallo-hydrolase [Chitinophagales bacterium]
MKIEQIYTGCLAEAAYYIESDGEVAIIDPLRESAPYMRKAEQDGAQIKYIFETHFHADFVSGHVELANKTGATIVYGPKANCHFNCYEAKDGEEFKVGRVTIKVLHTPGHTQESSTFLLKDEQGKDVCIFTGDTLFIGDVGRPDLAIKTDLTREDLAGMLYNSLHNKILPLADDVIIYPGHGAGSACGKSMSTETYDTLGHQKEVNYALKAKSKEQFIKEVTEGLLPPPQYFSKNAMMNKQGATSLDDIYEKGLRILEPADFETMVEATDALILDTRDPQDFAKGFVPGSINIGLNGQFAPWVGALIVDLQQPIAIVCYPGSEEEAVRRLARVGYDNTVGCLKGGLDNWRAAGKPVEVVNSLSPADFEKLYHAELKVLDVRRFAEHETGHVANAENKPLDYINDWMHELQRETTYYIHCAGGYRSMITASILKSRGFDNIVEVAGGYSAISKTGVPKTNETSVTK